MASPSAWMSAVDRTLQTTSLWDIIQCFLVVLVIYNITVIIYRLHFSPLARFPGPMITAATPWYETAIDLWNHNFPRVLKKMHEKHGNSQIRSPLRGVTHGFLTLVKVPLCEYLPGSSIFTTPTISTMCL